VAPDLRHGTARQDATDRNRCGRTVLLYDNERTRPVHELRKRPEYAKCGAADEVTGDHLRRTARSRTGPRTDDVHLCWNSVATRDVACQRRPVTSPPSPVNPGMFLLQKAPLAAIDFRWSTTRKLAGEIGRRRVAGRSRLGSRVTSWPVLTY